MGKNCVDTLIDLIKFILNYYYLNEAKSIEYINLFHPSSFSAFLGCCST